MIDNEQYCRMTALLRRYPESVAALRGINRALTALCYVLYPVLLLWRYSAGDARLARFVLVPGISFVLVSIFRALYNAPRPYEQGIDALMQKKTKGHSFPSRHVFSAFIIAMAWLAVSPGTGAALLTAGILLALIRVLGGVHYPRDVLAGAATGIAAGWIGFWLIP